MLSVLGRQFLLDVGKYLVLALGAGLFAGWLSSLNARPLRFWAQHPWMVFWSVAALTTVGFLLNAGRDLSPIFADIILIAILPISVLSAVHGLGVTWRRSRIKGTLIVVLSIVIDLMRLQGSMYPEVKLYHALLLSPAWILAAYIADRVGCQLAGKRGKNDSSPMRKPFDAGSA